MVFVTNNYPQNPYGSQNPYQSGGQPQPGQPSGHYPSPGQQPNPYQHAGSQPGSQASSQSGFGSAPGAQPGGQPTYGQTPYGDSYASQATGGGMPPGFGQPGPDGTVPINQPHYSIGFGGAYKRFFQKYVRFNGFASRGEFWWAWLMNTIISLVVSIPFVITYGMLYAQLLSSIDVNSTTNTVTSTSTIDPGLSMLTLVFGAISTLWSVAILLPTIAITIRRLHDAGFSGWFYLLNLIPMGSLIVLILCALETKPEKWQNTWYDNN